ncbi:MAG: porin [Flavobacteriales bacterium]|nr:porin [Flavobacteriales bacterium]
MTLRWSPLAAGLVWSLATATPLCAQGDTTKHVLKPGWWLIPGTTTRMTIGGYVKADLIHDLKPIGSPNYFDVSKIPTDGSTGTSTHLQAMETRIFLDVRRDSRFGEVRGFVEGDFFGSGNSFRLRHAIVQVGERWLVGQYWSTFMDELIIPATLDFEKPAAYAFARHAQFRYTHPLGDRLQLAVAVEEPSRNVDTPSPGTLSNPLPDLVARLKHTGTRGHLLVAGFVGNVAFAPDSGAVQQMTTSGVNLSGGLQVGEKDMLTAQVIYGPGIARYRFGTFGAPDANAIIQPITGLAATLGYQRHWSSEWTSFLVLNAGTDDPQAGQPGSDMDFATYGAVNLLWHFTPYAYAGVEYLHGLRRDINGDEGTADRIMVSVRMNIN